MNETSRFQEMLRVARRRRKQPGRLKCNITHGARPARGLPMSLIPEGRGRAKGNRTCVMLHFAELSQHDRGDTSKSNGRLVSGIFTSIAEFDADLIRDRVRSGLAAARLKGKRLGRPGNGGRA